MTEIEITHSTVAWRKSSIERKGEIFSNAHTAISSFHNSSFHQTTTCFTGSGSSLELEFDSIDAALNSTVPAVAVAIIRDNRFDANRPLLMSSRENSADTDSIDEAPAAALRSLDSNRPSMTSLQLETAATEAVTPTAEKPLLMFEDDFVPPSTSDAFTFPTTESVDSGKALNQPKNDTVPHPIPGSAQKEW